MLRKKEASVGEKASTPVSRLVTSGKTAAASDLKGKPQSGRGGFQVPEIAEVFRNAQELLGPIDDGLVVDADVDGSRLQERCR